MIEACPVFLLDERFVLLRVFYSHFPLWLFDHFLVADHDLVTSEMDLR